MDFERITEEQGPYRHLEKMSTRELLTFINKEDEQVPRAVALSIPQIEKLTEIITDKMLGGGRLFYLGCRNQRQVGNSGCQRNTANFWDALRTDHRTDCRW